MSFFFLKIKWHGILFSFYTISTFSMMLVVYYNLISNQFNSIFSSECHFWHLLHFLLKRWWKHDSFISIRNSLYIHILSDSMISSHISVFLFHFLFIPRGSWLQVEVHIVLTHFWSCFPTKISFWLFFNVTLSFILITISLLLFFWSVWSMGLREGT